MFMENERLISYNGGAVFVRKCPRCGRYVQADKTIMSSDESGLKDQANGTCAKHGRVKMLFCGFLG